MVAAYIQRFYTSFLSHVIDIPPRLLALLLFLILLVFPITRPTISIFTILITVNIMAIFAASWDLLVGRTGQMSLGHAFFYGVGAYGTAILWKFFDLPVWITIPIAVAISFVFATLMGYVCLRVKGPYLALVTMAIPLISIGILFIFPKITGAEAGIHGIAGFFPSLDLYSQKIALYYLTFGLSSISALILYKIVNSKTGIVFVSILDDELASEASGINTAYYKVLAFAISGLFAGLAGAVYAHTFGGANYQLFLLTLSFMAVMMSLVGGLGTIYGPILGAFILTLLDKYVLNTAIDVPPQYHLIIFIVPVILIVIMWPRGVARFVTDKLGDLEEARNLDERGPKIWKKYKKKEKEAT
jgi:branched-chain amino acid transport system permease protein